MAEKPPEEGYISVVDEEPEIFELLKWDISHPNAHQQKPKETRPVERPPSPEKKSSKAHDANPFDMADPIFIETYRLSKDLVRTLCEEIKPVIVETTKTIEFSIESKVLAALAYFATGKYQKSIAGKADPGLTQYIATTAVLQVAEAMNHPNIVKKYIHFPHLREERDVVKARFYMKYGIPNVVGCVDCTHVPVSRPEPEKSHFNKAYHSKKAQIICDSDQNIISVHATPGGSLTHDAILSQHAVKNDLESLNNSGEQCWLLGSLHYTQRQYIMTPIPKMTKKSPVTPEKYYCNVQAQAHSSITETIKNLRSKFKCLQTTCNRTDPNTVAHMIVACCVLHNMCNQRGLPLVPYTQTEERLEIMKQKVANNPIPRKQVEDPEGIEARAKLIERLWNERRVVPESTAKKRMSRKERILESHQPPQVQPMQQQHPVIHQMIPQPQHQMMIEDMSKRPRLVMNNPTYSLPLNPGWGHYPQH